METKTQSWIPCRHRLWVHLERWTAVYIIILKLKVQWAKCICIVRLGVGLVLVLHFAPGLYAAWKVSAISLLRDCKISNGGVARTLHSLACDLWTWPCRIKGNWLSIILHVTIFPAPTQQCACLDILVLYSHDCHEEETQVARGLQVLQSWRCHCTALSYCSDIQLLHLKQEASSTRGCSPSSRQR